MREDYLRLAIENLEEEIKSLRDESESEFDDIKIIMLNQLLVQLKVFN